MISIHAPAKGATKSLLMHQKWQRISIHAPAKGATGLPLFTAIPQVLSIHAPAKGATRICQVLFLLILLNFNPRTREGCDGKLDYFNRDISRFQSTHPRRVRLSMLSLNRYLPFDFNPRTREGCDNPNFWGNRDYNQISIHAPAKGATVLFSHFNSFYNTAKFIL